MTKKTTKNTRRTKEKNVGAPNPHSYEQFKSILQKQQLKQTSEEMKTLAKISIYKKTKTKANLLLFLMFVCLWEEENGDILLLLL